MGKRGSTNFEEKFPDVMSYAKLRLDGQGKRLRIRDQEDLRAIFKRLEASRRDKKGGPRMSDEFIDGLVESRAARKIVGSEIGRYGGKAAVLKREPPEVQRYKSQGRTVFKAPGGYAIKSAYKNQKGTLVVRFRDARTGRFIKKSVVEEEV